MDSSKIGAQLYSLRDHTQTLNGFTDTCERLAEIGFLAVQISAIGPIQARDVAHVARDNGLTLAATHVSWKGCLEDLEGIIREHHEWGCHHTAIGSLPWNDYLSKEGAKQFVHEMTPIAEALQFAGISFSHHNHQREFAHFDGKPWFQIVLDESAGSLLNFELDVHWAQAGGADPAVWIEKFSGRQPLLHCKDYIVTSDGKRRFAEVGKGNMNWPAILNAAKAHGVEWYVIEQDDCYGQDPFECLEISLHNLEQFFAEL